MRLFWAVNLPVDLKQKICGVQSQLRHLPVNVKWVEQHNLHLTVRFLGDVPGDRVAATAGAVQDAVAGTGVFDLGFKVLGFFPGPHRPRIVWLGIHGDIQHFKALYLRVQESMARLGFDADGKGFSPHLTLGRLRDARGSRELVRQAEDMNSNFELIGPHHVTTLELVESKLTPRGPVYSVLSRVDL